MNGIPETGAPSKAVTAPPSAIIGDRESACSRLNTERTMTTISPVPSTYLSPLERPRCPKCVQARMSLSKIETGPSGFDRRTFDCQKCGHVHSLIIFSDPMKSGVSGWLSSELGSPAVGRTI
jgi:hypothetical protein